jgi:uncharacterized protein (DUF362 family)/Pyruvate/2-oxoacid:ferredoxin oxidoreductase delta subunit
VKSTVSIVKCQNYDDREVEEGLRKAIGLLGGIAQFVQKGNRVLLKPNLLYGKAPEKAVTTHPSIVKGMIKIVREGGGIPFIGDSPAVGGLLRTADKAGIKSVANEMDCPLVEFDQPVLAPKGGRKFSKQLEIDRKVSEANVVINLPKWKTHGLTLLTLGVKNLFGCVPGTKKALWHLKAGQDRKVFAQMLVDLYQVVRPSLTILDGIIGMEGNGPNSGHPISLGLILASTDPLGLDQIVCDLLGIPREALPTNRVAFEEGLAINGVEVVGERVEQVKIPRFRLPTLSEPAWNLPGFLRKALKNALTSKPVFDETLCENCDQCIGACPPKALEKEGRGLVFDYGKCIRCFCCQEVCPTGAITIKPGWVPKIVNRIRSTKSLPAGRQAKFETSTNFQNSNVSSD